MSSTTVNEGSAIDLRQVVAMGTPKAVELWLDVIPNPGERARQVAALSKVELRKLGDVLASTTGKELFESVDEKLAGRVVRAIEPQRAAAVIGALDFDHAAEILREMSKPARESVLTLMPLDHANVLRGLLSWPEGSAAAHMVPEALTVRPTMTAAESIAAVREDAALMRSDSHTGAYIYVTDADFRLLGSCHSATSSLPTPTGRSRN